VEALEWYELILRKDCELHETDGVRLPGEDGDGDSHEEVEEVDSRQVFISRRWEGRLENAVQLGSVILLLRKTSLKNNEYYDSPIGSRALSTRRGVAPNICSSFLAFRSNWVR